MSDRRLGWKGERALIQEDWSRFRGEVTCSDGHIDPKEIARNRRIGLFGGSPSSHRLTKRLIDHIK